MHNVFTCIYQCMYVSPSLKKEVGNGKSWLVAWWHVRSISRLVRLCYLNHRCCRSLETYQMRIFHSQLSQLSELLAKGGHCLLLRVAWSPVSVGETAVFWASEREFRRGCDGKGFWPRWLKVWTVEKLLWWAESVSSQDDTESEISSA